MANIMLNTHSSWRGHYELLLYKHHHDRNGLAYRKRLFANEIAKVGSRHTIYLEKAFVEDSAFPFRPDEPLTVRIDKNKLLIAKE
jgi:hypothetical protein